MLSGHGECASKVQQDEGQWNARGRTGMTLPPEETDVLPATLAHISELPGAKVRIFLSEIEEGISNYRSMHSLTHRVEHQYHGHFLIELLQNAHDAFTENASPDRLRPHRDDNPKILRFHHLRCARP
jgi:hypothetical protein